MAPAVLIKVEGSDSADHVASKTRHALISPIATQETTLNENISIILHCDSSMVVSDLQQVITATKNISRGSNIVLQGLTLISRLAESPGPGIATILEELKANGISAVLEDPNDALQLTRQTRSEILDTANFIGLKTVPCITLSARDHAIDWDFFAQELSHARQVLASNSGLSTTALQVAPDTTIMPSEYLKALGLAKLSLSDSCQIWTPLQGFSALSPQKGLGASEDQHPVMKLVSTLGDFGSSGLGYLPINIFSQDRVIEDIIASGRLPAGGPEGHRSPTAWGDLNVKLMALRHIAAPQARV